MLITALNYNFIRCLQPYKPWHCRACSWLASTRVLLLLFPTRLFGAVKQAGSVDRLSPWQRRVDLAGSQTGLQGGLRGVVVCTSVRGGDKDSFGPLAGIEPSDSSVGGV